MSIWISHSSFVVSPQSAPLVVDAYNAVRVLRVYGHTLSSPHATLPTEFSTEATDRRPPSSVISPALPKLYGTGPELLSAKRGFTGSYPSASPTGPSLRQQTSPAAQRRYCPPRRGIAACHSSSPHSTSASRVKRRAGHFDAARGIFRLWQESARH
ncbi:hypothetical protein EV121DRAFT_297657 [Schizophyllum commune]